MPKLFASAVSGLAVVVLATGLVGCRSAATQLASVPGLGWLDRGDEGWANYEPAPGLPKPSDTNEPTSGGGAANIASNDKTSSPFSSPVSKVAKGDSKSRFDMDRYNPKKTTGDTSEKATTFGNYASAYGKFAPPKSGATDSSKGLATQEGPYSVDDATPNFASTDAAKDFSTDSPVPSFGPALNERAGETTKTPEFTASTNSRFGAAAFDKPTTAKTASTYTPPGFPSSTNNEATDRFAAASETAKSTLDQAKRFAQDSTSQFNNAATSRFDSGQQTFNRFANDAATKTENTLSQANNAMENAANSITNTASQTFNQFSNSPGQVTNSFSNVANAAQNQLNQTSSGQSQDSLLGAAKQTFNSAANTAQSTVNESFGNTVNNVAAGARDYAAGYQNAAIGAVNDIKNRFGNVAPAETPSISNVVQNATQNISQGVTSQVQNYAQGAVNTVEQGVVSKYEQAKSAASNYANSAINNATQQAGSMLNSATNNGGQQPVVAAAQDLLNNASDGLSQAATTAQGYVDAGQNAVNNVMQNVSNSAQTPPVQYPSTSTPNPFMNPPRALAPQASSVTPPPAASSYNVTPNYNTAPNFAPPANTTPPPSIQRDTAPFLPGSTKSYQGTTVVRKQEIELASAAPSTAAREPLVLAVGDPTQFPRSLR